MMYPRRGIFEGRWVWLGFGECVALLSLVLAARGQSTEQAEGYGACSTASELASVDAVQSATSTVSSFEGLGGRHPRGSGQECSAHRP